MPVDFDAPVRQPRARAAIVFSESNTKNLSMGNIQKLSILRERHVEGKGIPYGTMAANELVTSFEKDPTMHADEYRINATITQELGTKSFDVESYINSGIFFARKWDLSNKKVASVIAHDWRALLSDIPYSLMYNGPGRTIADEIVDILTEAGIPQEWYSVEGLTCSNSIIMMHKTTCFKAIKQCLEADDGYAVCDNDGIVHFGSDNFYLNPESFGVPVKVLNGTNHILRGLENKIDTSSFCTAVKITWYTFSIAAEPVEVIRATENITLPPGQPDVFVNLFIKWLKEYDGVTEMNTAVVAVSPTEMTTHLVQSEQVKPEGALIGLANDSTTDPITVSLITATGKPVTATAHIYELTNPDAIATYGKIVHEIDNKLITSIAQAQKIASTILARYNTPHKLWHIPSRCDPTLLPGDVISIPDNAGGAIYVQIESQNISFGLKGKGLSDVLIARAYGADTTDQIVSGSDNVQDGSGNNAVATTIGGIPHG